MEGGRGRGRGKIEREREKRGMDARGKVKSVLRM